MAASSLLALADGKQHRPHCHPLLQDDLICLASRVAASAGNVGPLVLCTRVTNVLSVTDPSTLRFAQIEVPPCRLKACTIEFSHIYLLL